MLTILIPCAGSGKRFKEAGYTEPKPLIKARGVPMLKAVIENVKSRQEHRWVFVGRNDNDLYSSLCSWFDGTSSWDMIGLDRPTRGAAETCLVAEGIVNKDDPLLITNCDQIIEGGIEPLLNTDADVAILTTRITGGDPRWSYVERSPLGAVLGVIEKPAEGHHMTRATTGHYWFKRAGDFFAAASCMIALNDTVNGEFYVAPAINYLITGRRKVKEVQLEGYGGKFHPLGTPEDLERYIQSERVPVSG